MEDPWKQSKEFFVFYFFCNLHFSNMASSVVTLGKAPLSKEPYQYVTTLRMMKLCRIRRSRLDSGIRTTKHSTIVAKKIYDSDLRT